MNETPRAAEELFLAALDLEADQRSLFLDGACAGDPALRIEVEALLDASARSSEYFDRLSGRLGIARVMSGGAGGPLVGAVGRRYGRYRLTEPVGSGGMGSVWRAARADGRFEGDVAVKLLSRNAGGAAPERFALEARYLAKLTHPNIARLLDAGVGRENQPYLVLELVDGLPIDRYCDEHALGVEQRIHLFLDVLDAVAHAHAHLIVHRDIKPSNVQVTRDGTVKLLDFGIAKLLGDESQGSALTREMGAALTPEFAAPEQLDGEVVTTATDVYSLGLLLCLLVTGSNPRAVAESLSLADLRALAHRQPARLGDALNGSLTAEQLGEVAHRRSVTASELSRTLQSDLDNIVRKALAVDTAERYDTVGDFAQDLRRYLRHEPVAAQAQTIRYRAQKFVKRHRGGVLAASLTVLALFTAAAVTAWQSVEARRQRDAAIYQQQRVQAANEFLTFLFEQVGPSGRALTMVELLDRGVSMLDRQYGAGGRFAGSMYYDIAHRYAGLGEVTRTLELFARAETIARTEGDDELLAATLCAIARNRYRSEPDAARARFAEASALLGKRSRTLTEADLSCARAEAILLELAAEPQAALNLLSTTLDRYLAGPFATPHTHGALLNDIGNMHYKLGRLDLCVQVLEEILELHRQSGRGDTSAYLIVSLNRATLLQAQGEIAGAHSALLNLLERVREADERDETPPGFWLTYAGALFRLARYPEALDVLTRVREQAFAGGDEKTTAEADLMIGRTLLLSGRHGDAGPYLDDAEQFVRRTPGVSGSLLQAIALARVRMHLVRGETSQAVALSEELLAAARRENRSGSLTMTFVFQLSAEAALAAGDARRAEAYASDFHAMAAARSRGATTSADVGLALLLRARAREAQGDLTSMAADLKLAIVSLVAGLGETHPHTLEARNLLARTAR